MRIITSDDLKLILEKHLKWLRGEIGGERANLSYANLGYANLRDANLSYANLRGANLRDADLRDANLSDANLNGADLRDANLRDAYLSGAYLSGANLRGANLRDANLSYANLSDANLSDANLNGADLGAIKNDYFAVLLKAIPEITNLRQAIIDGKIDGSTYDGKCACLCGTLEKSTSKTIARVICDQRDSNRPIERFFMGIKKGDTPETSQFSKLALDWLDEFLGYLNTSNEQQINS